MTDYARIASRLFNAPLMIRPEKAEMLVAVLAERLGIARLDRMDGSAMTAVEMNAMAAAGRSGPSADDRTYELIGGVAMIPIEGTLVHKSGWIGSYSGMTGYDGIAAQFREAMDDSAVKAIWLDFDSPGGEAAGCFDLVDEIFASNKASGGKPVWSFVNEQACSAAYALASAGDKVFMPRTGIAGSIGVYVLFIDQTDALGKEGLKVEFIRSGENKARESGLEPLTDARRAKLQAMVDADRLLFARTVARNRAISIKSVMDTEADWYAADDALAVGLIDGVLSQVEAFAKLQRSLARAG
jgi:ClpP class serine protease